MQAASLRSKPSFNPGYTDRVNYADSPIKNFVEELLYIRGVDQAYQVIPQKQLIFQEMQDH